MRTLLLLLLFVFSAGAQTRIGNEAAIDLPSSAKYRAWVGDAPADGAVEMLNPPIFKWIYHESPAGMAWPENRVRTFRFQLSTNTSFSSPYWDIVCSNNFYNTLPPITNANGSAWSGSNYWRVIYMNSNATVNVSTGNTHHFSFTNSPTEWNRAMLADSNYLLSIGTNHPHLFFFQTNKTAMATFLHTNVAMGFSWNTLTSRVYQIITNSWWNDDSFTNQTPASWAGDIAGVCLAYQIDPTSTLTNANPGQMVSRLASAFIANNYDVLDQNVIADIPKCLALAYDWGYADMTSLQRSNVLWTMEMFASAFVYANWYFSSYVTNRSYTSNLTCEFSSAAKMGSSHERVHCSIGLYMTMAGMGESALLRELQGYFLNYTIGQVDPFNFDEGRGYAEQSFRTQHNFAGQMLVMGTFREAQMHLNPWFIKYPRMAGNWQPLLYKDLQGQFGDYGFDVPRWNWWKYYVVAITTGDGSVLRHHTRTRAYWSDTDGAAIYGEGFLPYYYPTVPAEADWPQTYYMDRDDGWVMSSTYPANDWQAFTNGVGFVLSARPGGNRVEHGTFHDGAVQVWAYGAQVSCGGIGNYYKHPDLYPGLFVDGVGAAANAVANTHDYYAKLIAFTNAPDFTYVAEEQGRTFVASHYNGGAGNGNLAANLGYATNNRPYVTSVQRHVLFPHKKYIVLFDTFSSTQAAQFQWKWNIMEPGVTTDAANGSFTYTATNFYTRSNVTVYVKHITDPTALTFTNMAGTNAIRNPFTDADLYAYATDPIYTNSIWVRNSTPTTNWHFLSVVYPKRMDEPTPTITRLDDYTVKVQGYTNDGSAFPGNWVAFTDTNTFDTNYASAFTIMVDAGATNANQPSAPSAPTSLAATPGNQSVALTWGNPDALADGIHIQRDAYAGGSTIHTNLSSSATSWSDSAGDLANGTLYVYIVTRTNAFGSGYDSVQATPTAPASSGGGRAYVSGRVTVGVLKQ